MSQQQWDAPARGGSVKRARERAAAGKPTEPIPKPRPYDPTSPSNIPSPPRARLQGSSGMSKSGGQGAVGMAISRPTQVVQWPLIGTNTGSESQQYQPPPNRGPPPQRPPRPSHVPSLLDSSRIQDITPTFQYQPQQPRQPPQPQNAFPLPQARNSPRNQDDGFDQSFPSMQSPLTSSSRPSTVSSVGTIPDFPVPVPAIPPSARRSANLGPPPTSRRGASSYYSQASYVSPIPEVSEGMGLSPRTLPGSHSSYASSAAIPSSWGPESPGYYRSDEDDDDYENDRRFDAVSEGRESRGSDDNDDRGLIRSASIGKRARPSMITTRSSGQLDPAQINATPVQLDNHRLGPTPLQQSSSPSPVEAQRSAQWPITGNRNSPLASGTGLIDSTPSSSDESDPTIATAMTTDLPSQNGTRSPGANAMLGAYQAASALPSDTVRAKSPFANEGGPFSRLSAIRRPPRLNIDAVRDAEARGSLTSLPDLIRRATRLASMMDRGKRPGSRMALEDFPTDRDFPNEKEIELSPNFVRQDSTLSGMLSAFPTPGRETPARDTPRPASAWPEYDPNDPKSITTGKKQRKCCGLPCWGFIVVFIILLIIIAAAVVVPLKFLVIDKPPTTSTAATATPEQECAADPSTTCKNGGTSYIDSGVCSCICTNGFTGSTCTVGGSTGCTTTSSGSATNITIGDSIPRLISAAQTNFSVPLFENTILARFNAGNLSCASENSLVTFDGNDERIGNANAEATPTKASKIKKDAHSDSTKVKLRAIAGPDSTYTNIISDDSSTTQPTYANSQYQATSQISAASTSSPTTTKTSSAVLTTSTIDPTAVFTITEEVLDFARVTVLFVLQQENLDNAVTAQGQLQKFFNQQSFENLAAMNVSMGGGNSVNLVEFKLDLGNGTVGQKNTVT